MLTNEELKERIINLLISTTRVGVENLIEWLQKNNDFFVSPASTKYHLSCDGGLMRHSYSVYELFRERVKTFGLDVPEGSIIIISLLHDLCKVGAYIKSVDGYFWNRNHPGTHAQLSIQRIKKFIDLKPEEERCIKYHMGMYGTKEFSQKGEYSMQELVAAYNESKAAKLFYFCDDMSTQFLEG